MANSDVLIRMKADTQGYDANIAKARRQLDQFKKDNLSMGGVIKQLNGSLLSAAAGFASVTAAVGAFSAAIKSNIATAAGFEKSMSQLSSLTGMVGSDLEKLKGYAIELGSSTTLSASQAADAFKMIGSQQPQLLASGEALKAVTKNAITLAEAAGIELADAAKTLSVSINQMGGDSGNAERYINVLAAAAQKGAGDIVWLGEAITKSGTAAKAVGTDYEELVANLEQLAKAGYDASTAGTALRSIIMSLEKQANQQYKPSVVGLTEAFKNLGEANLTLTEYQGIAGKMFAAQAKALADAAAEAKNMKEEITGTNIAEEQAKTNTDNLDGSLKSLASAWEGLNLHINDSNGFLRTCVDWLKDVVVWADQAFTAAGRAQRQLLAMQGGGNGQPTTVDKQIAQLNSDNHTTNWSTYRGQVAGYNKQINELRDIASKWHEWQNGTISAESKKILDEYRNNNRNASLKWLEQTAGNLEKMRDEYMSRALEIIKPKRTTPDPPKPALGSGGGSDKNKNKNNTIKTEEQLNNEEINKLTQEYIHASEQRQAAIRDEIKVLQERNELIQALKDQAQGKGFDPTKIQQITDLSGRTPWATPEQLIKEADVKLPLKLEIVDTTPLTQLENELKRLQEEQNILGRKSPELWQQYQRQIDATKGKISSFKGEGKKEDNDLDKFLGNSSKVVSGLNSVASGLQQMGIELPEGVQKMLGVIQGLMSVIQGVNTVISVFSTSAETANTVAVTGSTVAMTALTAAVAANTAALGTNTVTNFIPFARGGVVRAAVGYEVPGNHFSGDMVPALLNSGETVLNRAQQGNLVSQLEGANGRSVNVKGVLQGEQIFLAAERWSKRTGKGEIVTW